MEKRTRVGLSLKPELNDAITRLAQLNGITKTAIITAMLTDMLPHLKILVHTLEKANSSKPKDAFKTLSTLMESAEEAFNEAQLSLKGLEKHINEPNK